MMNLKPPVVPRPSTGGAAEGGDDGAADFLATAFGELGGDVVGAEARAVRSSKGSSRMYMEPRLGALASRMSEWPAMLTV